MFTKNPNPKVSIILPTFNREKFITEAIDSVQKQSYPYWELLIIDDGSDDNTEELISAKRDERIRFFKHHHTGVIDKLRNVGLQKATGELIAFIDSDDLWDSGKLAKQVAALQEYSDAGFCLVGGYNFRNNGEPVNYFYKERDGIKYGDIFLKCFRSEIPGFTQALMLHKDCIDVSGVFDENKDASCFDFIISLAANFKAVIIYEPLFFRRLHDTNTSAYQWEKRNFEWLSVIKLYRRKKRLSPRFASDCLFRFHINFGIKYLDYDQPAKAIPEFFRAWFYNPFSITAAKKIAKSILILLKIKH